MSRSVPTLRAITTSCTDTSAVGRARRIVSTGCPGTTVPREHTNRLKGKDGKSEKQDPFSTALSNAMCVDEGRKRWWHTQKVQLTTKCADTKTPFELGLPIMKTSRLVKVHEDESAPKVFRYMRKQGVGDILVVDRADKPVGSIIIKDIKHLLTVSESNRDYRTLMAKEFIANERQSSGEKQMGIMMCTREDMVRDIILKLGAEKRHSVYIMDEEGNLDGLITLRDIIAKLVYELSGYFGDFFNCFIPMPRV